MDTFVIGSILLGHREERFEDDSPTKTNTSLTVVGIVWNVVLFLIGLYAGYLSWSCNSIQGYTILAKVFFSFFAFVFGTLYLVLYWIFRSPCV